MHIFVAFDWGSEINLDRARELTSSEKHSFPRKARTPSSINYQPSPLRARQPSIALDLPSLGSVAGEFEVTLFDFGAVSACLRIPIQIDRRQLTELAGTLSDRVPIVSEVRKALEPLFQTLTPAIHNPAWSEVAEEYFVFQVRAGVSPDEVQQDHQAWVAGIVRLESGVLSESEIEEATRLKISYSPRDLFVPDWAAAFLIDSDCDELLDTIAFANVQLLEMRHIDARLDSRLQDTYDLIHRLARRWLPFWKPHTRTVRVLGELKIEMNVLLERSGSALKLVGDPYLARAYHLVASRFHLEEWSSNIRSSLNVLEGTYQVLVNQAAIYRAEVLELAIIGLIFFEIVFTLFRRD
ncbi:MAG: hypothetical protein AB7O26_12980 [Planctomycetaceae bacterium]